MGFNTRCIPMVTGGSAGTITAVAGSPNPADPARRYYTAGLGSTVDAQGLVDADAAVISSQGFIPVALVGTTAARNSTPASYWRVGQQFLDSTLGITLIWNGSAFINPATGGAV
jgi:hypothetical protein